MYFEAPSYDFNANDFPQETKTLFIGGGITNCEDWQTTVVEELLKTVPNVVIFNPRRKSFHLTEENRLKQISWEFFHLTKSDAIIFWLPADGECLTTLFELGKEIGKRSDKKNIFIGIDRYNKMAFDLVEQLKLENIVPFSTLSGLVESVKIWASR